MKGRYELQPVADMKLSANRLRARRRWQGLSMGAQVNRRKLRKLLPRFPTRMVGASQLNMGVDSLTPDQQGDF